MKIRKIMAVTLSFLILLQYGTLLGCGKKDELKILDKDKQMIASLEQITSDKTELSDYEYRAYLEIVIAEGKQMIADLQQCTLEEAEKQLLCDGYTIYTSFDNDIFQSIKNAYETQKETRLAFGCAVTDLKGNLLAVHSAGETSDAYTNFATAETSPYSSLKPLSVYAPAIESGSITWSQVYEDSPLKEIADGEGEMRDWPKNATGTYSYENETVAAAIRQSLNTVAVKCLQSYGVNRSLDFLKNSFGINLKFERNKAAMSGEEEVLGNVALGYLYSGVSPVNMAGYYQIFANGGIYYAPHTILKICDRNGKTVCESSDQGTRVVKKTTAYIMNRLLQGVVSYGGTGEAAGCDDIVVGGKTGTGDDGNWFVGFTPQYSCAIWHGKELPQNHAAELFSEVVSRFAHNSEKSFPECSDIKEAVYCCESGLLLSDKCRKIDRGYYAPDCMPAICDKH